MLIEAYSHILIYFYFLVVCNNVYNAPFGSHAEIRLITKFRDHYMERPARFSRNVFFLDR